MIIKTERNAFAEAIHIVSKFSERRSATLPSLAGIALVAGRDGIRLRATNLETGVDLSLAGSVEGEGLIVLPAGTLTQMSSSLPGNGSVTLEHAGDTVTITSGGSTSKIKTLPAEDFPLIPVPTGSENSFTLPGETLISLIQSVGPSASTSSVRPDLGSILISFSGGILKAVASDSFRLAEKKTSISGTIKPFSVLIPAKNALDIAQILPKTEVQVLIDEHQCAFSWEGGVVSTRLVAANYPDYEQIIPKTFVSGATVLKKDLEASLRRTAVFSDAFQKVRLGFDQKEKKIFLSAKNSEVGESAEGVSGAVSGESLELSFNHRYLAAPLSLIGSDNVTLSAAGIGRPLVIKGAGDTSFLYLVMPMNQ